MKWVIEPMPGEVDAVRVLDNEGHLRGVFSNEYNARAYLMGVTDGMLDANRRMGGSLDTSIASLRATQASIALESEAVKGAWRKDAP